MLGKTKHRHQLKHMLIIFAKQVMWKWKPDGLIKDISTLTNHTDGLLLFAVKDSLRDKMYMYIGNDIVFHL